MTSIEAIVFMRALKGYINTSIAAELNPTVGNVLARNIADIKLRQIVRRFAQDPTGGDIGPIQSHGSGTANASITVNT